jgi:hypothetical protein
MAAEWIPARASLDVLRWLAKLEDKLLVCWPTGLLNRGHTWLITPLGRELRSLSKQMLLLRTSHVFAGRGRMRSPTRCLGVP